MKRWQAVVVGLSTVGAVAQIQAGPIHIVVNRGDYPTAQAAAGDEANVCWDDGNDADDIVCTECFAAVELQKYLRKMAGDAGQSWYVIADDDEVPADGELILLGSPRTNKAVRKWAARLGINEATFDDLGPEGYVIKCAGKGDPGSADTAEASGIDLEHRRELAVKTLRERAQQCPPQSPEANGAKEDEAVPSTPARTEAPAVASQAAPGYSFEADIVTNSAMDLSIDLDLSEVVRRVAREDGDGWDLQIVEEPESFPDEFAPEPPVPLKEIWWKGERLVPLQGE